MPDIVKVFGAKCDKQLLGTAPPAPQATTALHKALASPRLQNLNDTCAHRTEAQCLGRLSMGHWTKVPQKLQFSPPCHRCSCIFEFTASEPTGPPLMFLSRIPFACRRGARECETVFTTNRPKEEWDPRQKGGE